MNQHTRTGTVYKGKDLKLFNLGSFLTGAVLIHLKYSLEMGSSGSS